MWPVNFRWVREKYNNAKEIAEKYLSCLFIIYYRHELQEDINYISELIGDIERCKKELTADSNKRREYEEMVSNLIYFRKEMEALGDTDQVRKNMFNSHLYDEIKFKQA